LISCEVEDEVEKSNLKSACLGVINFQSELLDDDGELAALALLATRPHSHHDTEGSFLPSSQQQDPERCKHLGFGESAMYKVASKLSLDLLIPALVNRGTIPT
jgi:hypothetical protein